MKKSKLTPKQIFKEADADKSGEVTIAEFKLALDQLLPDENITTSELAAIAEAFDINKNGLIEENEFLTHFANPSDPQKIITPLKSEGDLTEKV